MKKPTKQNTSDMNKKKGNNVEGSLSGKRSKSVGEEGGGGVHGEEEGWERDN